MLQLTFATQRWRKKENLRGLAALPQTYYLRYENHCTFTRLKPGLTKQKGNRGWEAQAWAWAPFFNTFKTWLSCADCRYCMLLDNISLLPQKTGTQEHVLASSILPTVPLQLQRPCPGWGTASLKDRQDSSLQHASGRKLINPVLRSCASWILSTMVTELSSPEFLFIIAPE